MMAMQQPPEYDWRNDPEFAAGTASGRTGRGGVAPANDQTHRTSAEFERAHRHSRRVRFLKRALPIGGLAAIVVIIIAFFVTAISPGSIDLGETRIENGRLVMRNPQLTGTDDAERPFNLTADKAFQQADNPTRISLEGISGRLPMSDTEFAVIRAGNGIYDTAAETLVLDGNIAVDTDTGLAIRLRDADIDIDSGRMRSDSSVSVDTGRAQITAESLTIEDNGRVIVFENRVRMRLLPFSQDEEAGSKEPAEDADRAQGATE